MNLLSDEKPKEAEEPSKSYLDDIAEQSEGVPEVVVDRDNEQVVIDGRVVVKAYRVPLQAEFIMPHPIADLTKQPGSTLLGTIAYYGLETKKGPFYELKRHTKELRMLSEASARELLSKLY